MCSVATKSTQHDEIIAFRGGAGGGGLGGRFTLRERSKLAAD